MTAGKCGRFLDRMPPERAVAMMALCDTLKQLEMDGDQTPSQLQEAETVREQIADRWRSELEIFDKLTRYEKSEGRRGFDSAREQHMRTWVSNK